MGDYLQKLTEFSDALTQLKDKTSQGLEDFFAGHPNIKTAKNLVMNYGDMVPAVGAGLALTPFGQAYGDIENRIYVLVGGAALGAIVPLLRDSKLIRHDSRLRNAYAGLAAVVLGQNLAYPNQLTPAEFALNQLNYLAVGWLSISGAKFHDNFRKQENSRLKDLSSGPIQHA